MSALRPSPPVWPARLPGRCPVTWTVIAANAVTFLVAFAGVRLPELAFATAAFAAAPWTALTYPLVGGRSILGLLLSSYVLGLFGGSLERAWGRRDYLLFWALVSAGPALAVWVGAALLDRSAVLAGLWVPLAAMVAAWATINPDERLLLYFAIPLAARWLGLIAAAVLVFSLPPPLGLFALAGPGLAWWYVRDGRFRLASGRARPRARRPIEQRGFGPLAAWRRYRQKRRFLRMMRRAGLLEPPQDRRRWH